ncbi:MAG: OmpA family protein [Chitinophagales bacterium]|nr:OmpA family protein [Chitinophagales bacterium]
MNPVTCIGLAVCLLMTTSNAKSQIINPKKILERKANKAIEKKTEQAVDSLFDKKEKQEPQEGTKEPAPVKTGNAEQKPVQDTVPSLLAYSKFDFVPGEKVIFFDDFRQDNIGDFPALWNTNGSAEIVTTNLLPGHWMKFVSREAIWTDELLKLPDNYTVEFDIIPIKGEEGRMAGYDFRLLQSINPKSYDHGAVPGKAGFLFSCEYFGRTGYRTYINSDEGADLGLSGTKEGQQYYQEENKKYHIAVWVQKARIRLYQDEQKIFDLPKAFPLTTVKMDRIRFEEGAAMVSNIRIAIGNPDMRSKLLTEGKLVSYGIYFDVNKDMVKPASYATLKEIAAVLTENPAVKIKIVGHTDADGADAANLDLSKRRAASVKNELVKSFAIDASRIETEGKGETQPVTANDTPSNKALNRRVEFIKL